MYILRPILYHMLGALSKVTRESNMPLSAKLSMNLHGNVKCKPLAVDVRTNTILLHVEPTTLI
jgi:hypothetical protein